MASELVAGSTGKDFVDTLKDSVTGLPLNLTGFSCRLQGTSEDRSMPALDQALSLSGTPADGTVTYSQAGNFITPTNLGGKARAAYICRVKITDGAGKVNYGPSFELDWVATPI
jgi:hypothetical protein